MPTKSVALTIFLLSFLSIGKIINYYFFYDDFFLFYALQFPADRDSIFQSSDSSAYLFLQPFFTPLFHLFKYEPLGYFVVSFFLFPLLVMVFYWFVNLLSGANKKIAIFSSLIMASAYVGVEAFSWNMGAGPNSTIFLISSFVCLSFILLYFKRKTFHMLVLALLSFSFSVYFFQFRSFLLFLWVGLLFAMRFNVERKISKDILFLLVALFTLGLFLYRDSLSFNSVGGLRLQIDLINFLTIFTRNIGNVFFPAEILTSGKKEIIAGVFSVILLLGAPVWAFLKRVKERPLVLFFSASTVLSLLLMQTVIGLTINAPDVWYSSHRFYFVILPFLAGFLGVLIYILYENQKTLSLILMFVILTSHVFLSINVIQKRWENPISHIKYFYEAIKKYVPVLDKNSVLLVTQGEPTPVSIFVSARDANAYAGPAGFYGIKSSELNLSTSPQEAIKMLSRLNLSEDNLYALHYRRNELLDLTQVSRNVLKEGIGKSFAAKSGEEVMFDDISLPASIPVRIDAKLRVAADFSSLSKSGNNKFRDIQNPERYFAVLFEQEKLRKNTKARSGSSPLSAEHMEDNIIDGHYDTTWIPNKWGESGVSLVVDLGKLRRTSRIVWSSSRTSSWYVRLPSSYKVETSKDGTNFKEVANVTDPPVLKTGEFFSDNFQEEEIKFVRLTIFSTRGGLTPAVDEIELFNDKGDINVTDYFKIKQNPDSYFSSYKIAEDYLNNVLDNRIPLDFGWRVDSNGDYPVGQSVSVNVRVGTTETINLYPPIVGEELKSLRIKPMNFPATIFVEDFKIVYPRLSEVSNTE